MGDSFIIAIDFGTAYSGYAFSVTTGDADSDPHLKYWGEEIGVVTPKTPTCILFDELEEFLSFGYEANLAYVRMRGDKAKKAFFFQSFKMSLYGKVSKIDYRTFIQVSKMFRNIYQIHRPYRMWNLLNIQILCYSIFSNNNI